jgi:hypothetical protein
MREIITEDKLFLKDKFIRLILNNKDKINEKEFWNKGQETILIIPIRIHLNLDMDTDLQVQLETDYKIRIDTDHQVLKEFNIRMP